MRVIDNWDDIQERQAGDYDMPIPGAYIAKIFSVKDNEEKKCLEICWDFAEGAYIGENQATYFRAKFWPTRLFQSYKDSALGFLKAFKTAVEESNPGYRFDTRAIEALDGKKIGVVLGSEEYRKNDGSVGERLYVYQVRSIRSIQNGDFTVPKPKTLKSGTYSAGKNVYTRPASNEFAETGEDDGELPF